jgi:thiamine pyrophosphokinase
MPAEGIVVPDSTHIAIVTGGEPLAAAAADLIRHCHVIAADSGLDHALAAGLEPELLVGDLDSVSPAGLEWAREHRIPVQQHPADKDCTDTELALVAAAVLRPHRITVVGGVGDRLDHLLGTLLALGHDALDGIETQAIVGTTVAIVVRPGAAVALPVEPGATFSVLALHGPATGVTLTGSRWPLTHADLSPTTALGLSNIAEDSPMLTVTSGLVTAVIP